MRVQIQTVTQSYDIEGEISRFTVNFRTVSDSNGYISGYFIFLPDEYNEKTIKETIISKITQSLK